MVSYGSTSFDATSGAITAVSISSLGVNDGCSATEGDWCSCTISCPGTGTPNPEQITQGSMLGFVYMPTTVAASRAPSTPYWVAASELNWTPAQGSPAEVRSFRVPPGAIRVAWLPSSDLAMSNGSALLVLSACKRSGA